MANEQNLINGKATQFQSGEKAAKNGKKGGINSGKSKREKKTIKNLLNDFLEDEIGNRKSLKEMASTLGLKNTDSIKKLFAIVCTINTLQNGDLGDLERLVKLLGEDKDNENKDVIAKLDKVLGDIDAIADE